MNPLPKKALHSMLRVNQAGEFGAIRIYKGQQDVLGDSSIGPTLTHMYDQEKQHKDLFDALLVKHQVRPTALSPLWHITGYLLGYGSALLGKKAAMACTVAVEEVIDAHYQEQLDTLSIYEAPQDIKDTIEKCHVEECEHRDIGLQHGAQSLPAYLLFSTAIKGAAKLAIWLSKRI